MKMTEAQQQIYDHAREQVENMSDMDDENHLMSEIDKGTWIFFKKKLINCRKILQ